EANSGLPIGIGPGYLTTCLNFQDSIRQLKVESQQYSAVQRFRGEHLHAGFGEIQKNSIHLAIVRQRNLYRRLYRNPECPAPFPAQQSGGWASPGPPPFLA